jgi:hypothetical protein
MTPKTIRVGVAPTTRTDLLCILCGCFRCDMAIVSPVVSFTVEAHAGVHRRCWLRPKRRRTPTPASATKPPEPGDAP